MTNLLIERKKDIEKEMKENRYMEVRNSQRD